MVQSFFKLFFLGEYERQISSNSSMLASAPGRQRVYRHALKLEKMYATLSANTWFLKKHFRVLQFWVQFRDTLYNFFTITDVILTSACCLVLKHLSHCWHGTDFSTGTSECFSLRCSFMLFVDSSGYLYVNIYLQIAHNQVFLCLFWNHFWRRKNKCI